MKQLIVYQVTDKGIENSLGESKFQSPYLDFLLQTSKDVIKLFVNLDDDVARLLRLIKFDKKQLEKLNKDKQIIVGQNYKITYIPGKWFGLEKGFGTTRQWTGFSDLSQYEDLAGDIELDKHLAVAQEVYSSFLELGFNPTQLISPANIYRKEVLTQLDIPKFDNIPIEAMQMAYAACKGNWVEAFAIGKFDKVWDYDITSAYPYQASKLLDLRLGTWKQNKEYQKEATYGYCKCEVNIDSDFSPIIKQFEDRNYTPKGVFETTLTKNEIDFINEWNLGFVTILDGWWWTHDIAEIVKENKYSIFKIPYPFKQEIDKLYKQKQESTGIKREIVKRIMNGSFYGVFIEIRDDEFGDLFMAPYAAEIEANTRLKIANIYMHNKLSGNIVNLLHIAVDGIIVDQEIDFYDYESPDKLGQWRAEHESVPAIICSSGLVCIDSKFGKGDFSISYEKLNKLIQDNPNTDSYTMRKKTVLSLAQANNLNRIEDVGLEQEISRTVEFGDAKRYYEDSPETFEELVKNQYHSQAWDIEILETLENPVKIEEEELK